jgi:hypothetical protein
MLFLALLATETFSVERAEIRFLAGGQIDADSHGEVDVGVRSGAFSAELFTDTLDLRWSPSGDQGRQWVNVRGQGFAGAMMISPWTAGEPDPTRALILQIASVESGLIRYGPHGLYGGAQISARALHFVAREETDFDAPSPHFVGGASAIGGFWSPALSAYATIGVEGVVPFSASTAPSWMLPYGAVGAEWVPSAAVEVQADPRWWLSPIAEVRAGYAEGAGAALAYRLGGQMPYVVPIAGAAWGEFWARDYAAARLGLAVGSADAQSGSGSGARTVATPTDGKLRVRGKILIDLAYFHAFAIGAWGTEPFVASVFAPQFEVGTAARLELRRKAWWLLVEGGFLPTANRPLHQPALSGMFRFGVDWSPLGPPSKSPS